ncbi:hypothetical protein [Sodalis-like endosymbiont of Proechinophthirus fluctus]|uniref:hypothetical protein n=1 Tax=Sodalis-like endosymbiont of Proechinophthirus fluctus TaxID=1462730 RepID=UPI003F753145
MSWRTIFSIIAILTGFPQMRTCSALEKVAHQHPDNSVGQFCYFHFSRIYRLLRSQRPFYHRDVMADNQQQLPF